ncbi:MAG TPA: DUF438 domain-containing protein [bacterium]|nr:DUF438 domain-containing protein [bacterium]
METTDGAKRLKQVIDKLATGAAPADVKREFHELIKGASAEEVASMEQSLIDGGLPVEEVQRLCEVHADIFKGGLEKQPRANRLPGHPVHTYLAENREARKRLRTLRFASLLGDVVAIRNAAEDLRPIIVHYTRKENQLFPFLEATGFTGPSRVMWGKHDDIRARFKTLDEAMLAGDLKAARREARSLAGQIGTVMFMEERILFPTALKRLSPADWAKVRAGEDAIGFAWVKPGAVWDPGLVGTGQTGSMYGNLDAAIAAATTQPESGAGKQNDSIPLSEGALPRKILDLMLKNLPLDVSFVDANDRVLYYSDSPHRVFPRSPGVIGRAVQNCHPQKSVATVERILAAFKKKEKDKADFWIQMGDRFIIISYKALYDDDGTYLGTLESSWDATDIRALQGQRRLLDW